MRVNSKKWVAFCLVNVCWFHSSVNATPISRKTVRLYGIEQSAKIKANKRSYVNYTLQLASFKHQQYAINYRNKMAGHTTERVLIIDTPTARLPYHVVIGPMTNETLRRVTHQLLAETGLPLQKARLDVTQQSPHPSTPTDNPKVPKAHAHGQTNIVTISVGPAWDHPQNTQTFRLQPDIKKTYASTNGSSSLISGEMFLGFQKPLHSMMEGQLGLALAGASNSNLSGNVWEDGDPNFNNFVYKYNVNHIRVALKGKLLSYMKDSYQPYISGSLGVGFNHAYDFRLAPNIYEEIPAPLFQTNTTTAFTYTLGLGVQKAIQANWQMGIGYEFSDWGQSHLAAAPGQTVGRGPSLSHLYMSQLQLSLTYIPKK